MLLLLVTELPAALHYECRGNTPPGRGGIQVCLFLPARGGGGLVSIRKSNWNSSMTSYRKGKGAGQTQISTLPCHVRTSARQETQWDLSSASFFFICFFLCLVKQGSWTENDLGSCQLWVSLWAAVVTYSKSGPVTANPNLPLTAWALLVVLPEKTLAQLIIISV